MKQNLKAHTITTVVLLLLSIVSALIIATIHQLNVFSASSYNMTSMIVSFILFAIAGFTLGLQVNKAGLLHALIFASCYLLLVFLILFLASNSGLDMHQIILNLVRCLILVITSIIGRNLRPHQ